MYLNLKIHENMTDYVPRLCDKDVCSMAGE